VKLEPIRNRGERINARAGSGPIGDGCGRRPRSPRGCAVSLGAIQSRIGGANDTLDVLAFGIVGCKPDANCRAKRSGGRCDAFVGDKTAYTFAHCFGGFEVAVAQHGNKLFTTITADGIDLAYRPAHTHRNLNQHSIARLMAIGIVDILEMVRIDHRDA
jgi:hypothetical protein